MENVVMKPSRNFWSKKRVLITGHTGFKGGWLTFWLHKLGAEVKGLSLPPTTSPNLFFLSGLDKIIDGSFTDIRDRRKFADNIRSIAPHIVFHLAAQPLVRAGYKHPVETFETNVMGTVNLLDTLLEIENLEACVIITTDKVYKNHEWPYPYREEDELGGHDPYSSSKAATEIVVESYRQSFFQSRKTGLATARAGNVIGGGDWAKDRLIPDAVRAWQNGRPLKIRRPDAVRPWQHVLEPLYGYLVLAEKLTENHYLSGPFNFGPDPAESASVKEVVTLAREFFGRGDISFEINKDGPHEAGMLALETAKVRSELKIKPQWSLDEAVKKTIDWYRQLEKGENAGKLCYSQLAEYEKLL
jgi:CDP-glucose 4,6-dehydratase